MTRTDAPDDGQDGQAFVKRNGPHIAALRQLEDDLDRLVDELLIAVSDLLPNRFIELDGDSLDDEKPRGIGKAVTVKGVIVDDLHECVEAVFAEFDWPLERALRQLREALR